MKASYFRLVLLMGVLLLATGLAAQPGVENPDPGGGTGSGGGCYVCKGIFRQDGSWAVYCGAPPSGGFGSTSCVVEFSDGYGYCVDYGDNCCVD